MALIYFLVNFATFHEKWKVLKPFAIRNDMRAYQLDYERALFICFKGYPAKATEPVDYEKLHQDKPYHQPRTKLLFLFTTKGANP